MGVKYLSTGECAKRKGVSRQAVVSAINRGHIRAEKIGPNYAIEESVCDAYEPAMEYSERSRRRWGAHKKPDDPAPKRPRGRPPTRASLEEGEAD